MSRFDIVDSGAMDSFEIVVEVSFERALTPMEIVIVLQTITQVTTSNLASALFEGFSHVAITETDLAIRFRYAKRVPDRSISDGTSSEEQENMSRRKVQFVFFLFATIDTHARFADVPFPPDFRAFLALPDELGLEG